MKLLKILIPALLFCSQTASAQQETEHAVAIAAALGSPAHQWVFNHMCVPVKELAGPAYSNRDFVDAYFIVTKNRWNAALAAKASGNENASMAELAKILHGIIDSYWPNRIRRDASGAIVAFSDCESLGGLHGVLLAEKSGGPDSDIQKTITTVMTEVIRRWKDGASFDGVAFILRSGPMKLSAEYADSSISKTP